MITFLKRLKTAVAWGLVPLVAETVLGAGESFLKANNRLFFLKLLNIHSNNIRRATSQHLTDNLSARLESFSYQVISDGHNIKKTDDLQKDLQWRSLFTFSLLSLHAQKSRKTFFRLQSIMDTITSSASLALSRNDIDRAAKLMALSAQVMIYLHPEYLPNDVLNSVHLNFSKHITWDEEPGFRKLLTRQLIKIDPLYSKSAIIRLRYCDLFNQWKMAVSDCTLFEASAIKEIESLAVKLLPFEENKGAEQPGIVKTILANVPPDQVRNWITFFGVFVPGIMLYYGKRHPAIDVLVKHFAKVIGLSTTKEYMERFASNSRRTLENWGAIDTSQSFNRTSGIGDYANQYLSALQKNAGKILAEQPNFARSNSQRALELIVLQFSEAYRSMLANEHTTASILAGAMVHYHKEMVELSVHDTLVRALLMSYQPLNNETLIPLVQNKLRQLDPGYRHDADLQEGYQSLIAQWRHFSDDAVISSGIFPGTSEQQTGSCPAEGCPGSAGPIPASMTPGDPAGDSSWLGYLLPSRKMLTTATIHGTALGYNIMIALIQPYTIDKFKPRGTGQPFWQLSAYYFLLSMVDFGLRSIGEPAIVHLQTVIKNQIGSTTGILSMEDAQIQDELADKVSELNRKLSIEAQTSRSYKMTIETLLIKCWSMAAELITDPAENYADSASIMAYAVYLFRYFHPEFEEGDGVISALAKARLTVISDKIQQKSLTGAYSNQVLVSLAQLDPNFNTPVINNLYLGILRAWGFDCEPSAGQHAQDVLDSWAVYGDWLLGGGGLAMQAITKAAVHSQGFITRSLVNFAANVLEFGTTDPLRKRIYAYSRQKMLNVLFTDEPVEQVVAEYANEQLTYSYRRQKFYFGKPELDMRTQLMQMITSVINGFSGARVLIAANETGKAVDLIALTMVRLILYAPDLSGDDSHLTNAIRTVSLPFRDSLSELNAEIITRVGELLNQTTSLPVELYATGINKAHRMSQAWVSQDSDL